MKPETVITVRVVPRASREEISVLDGGAFKVKLTAPPVEGKANQALKHFLSQKLGVAKRDVEIVTGERSRIKTVRIIGLSRETICRMLIGQPEKTI